MKYNVLNIGLTNKANLTCCTVSRFFLYKSTPRQYYHKLMAGPLHLNGNEHFESKPP